MMRYFLLVFMLSVAFGETIPTIYLKPARTIPVHIGIDERLVPYDASYKFFSSLHNINFTKPVSIGFGRIISKKGKRIVGLCHYAHDFREIDIDIDYWNESSLQSRETLIFHEMTHCRCTRFHDWGNTIPYPEPKDDDGEDNEGALAEDSEADTESVLAGFMIDGCPLSIMYPYVVDDSCMKAHKIDYMDEMFDRCKPY